MPATKNVAAETASRATLGVEMKGSGANSGGGDDGGDDEGVGGDDDDGKEEEEKEKEEEEEEEEDEIKTIKDWVKENEDDYTRHESFFTLCKPLQTLANLPYHFLSRT